MNPNYCIILLVEYRLFDRLFTEKQCKVKNLIELLSNNFL